MIKIEPFVSYQEQYSQLGRHEWAVTRLIELSRDLPVMEIPLVHLNIYKVYDRLTIREMVMHMRAVLSADLAYPIILDEDGDIMDGRHRVMRAIIDGCESIRAVRFETNPRPCRVLDE